jgi:hypothetical protein
MEPIADKQTTNDGNADAENIHPNINNHPIEHYGDEDDANGLLNQEMMDEPAVVETTTNDNHSIGTFANGNDGEDDGEDDGNTTTDSTSEVSNEDISIDGQNLKRAKVVGTRNVKFGRRIIKDVPNHSVVITKKSHFVKLQAGHQHWKNISRSTSSKRCTWKTDARNFAAAAVATILGHCQKHPTNNRRPSDHRPRTL